MGRTHDDIVPRAENFAQPMKRIFEIGLTGGVSLAVLAFGGTEAPYFSIVQITILGLGVLLLATYHSAPLINSRPPVVIPLLLVAFVLAQWFHLPGARNSPGEASFRAISIAPYETLSHLPVLATYFAAFY